MSGAAARLQVMATALLFSTGGAAIKFCSLSAWQVACFRSGLGALTILAMLPTARRRWNRRIVLVGGAYGTTLLLYAVANKLTTAANTIFLQSTAPIYVLILAPWLLRERIRSREVPFVAAIAAGMVLLFVRTEPASELATDPWTGNLLGAASGIFWALTVMGLRWLERSEQTRGSAAAAAAAGNVFVLLGTLPWALPISASIPTDWLVIGHLGLFQIGLAYVFLTRAIHRLSALEAILLLMLEPVLNPVWAWWLLGERPGPWALAGGATILLASALKTAREATAGKEVGGVPARSAPK